MGWGRVRFWGLIRSIKKEPGAGSGEDECRVQNAECGTVYEGSSEELKPTSSGTAPRSLLPVTVTYLRKHQP